MNIFLIEATDIFKDLIARVKETGTIIESNFEQVYAMVKQGEVTRLSIWISAFNYSGSKWNGICGQKIAEEIHKINPTIPIQIWEGKEYDCPDNLPPMMQVYGKEVSCVQRPNETYLSFKDHTTREKMIEIIREFFNQKT